MFDVYVDGATVASHDALVALASAIALRHGGAASDLMARLARGPLRMATSVTSEIADRLRRNLEALGARVRVQPSHPGAAADAPPDPAHDPHRLGAPRSERRTSPPASAPPSRLPALAEGAPALPPALDTRPMRSSLPPQPAPRPVVPVLPPAPASRGTRSSLAPGAMPLAAQADGPRSMRSSLSPQPSSRPITPSLPPPWEQHPGGPAPIWAGSVDARGASYAPAAGDLVAPPAEDWSLDPIADPIPDPRPARLRDPDPDPIPDPDLDEDHGAGPDPGSIGPLPASIGPLVPRASAPEISWPGRGDPFSAPSLAVAEPALELAELPRASRSLLEQPPAAAARPASDREAARVARRAPLATPQTPTAIAGRTDGAAPTAVPGATDPDERTARMSRPAPGRVRFAAGVLLAIGLGFVPAHLVADLRERHAFAAIDAAVVARQAAADTPERYAALDEFRAEQGAIKRNARRRIALASLAIWAAVGGALAYGWFRLIPWRPPG